MSIRDVGSYIGYNRVTSTSQDSASGIWSLAAAERRMRAAAWPVPPVPLTISGLQLWLDASDADTLFDATSGGSLVAADGGVARWEDKSGNGLHATQATAANRAARKTSQQNGLDAILFDGTNDRFFISPSLSSSNRTFFFACKPQTTSTAGEGRYLFDSETGRLILAQHDGASPPYSSVASFSGSWVENGLSTTASQVLTFRLNSSGTSSRVYRNGSQLGADFAYTSRALGGTTAIGGDYSGGSSVIDGLLYEVLVYDSALSDTDREAVENYLLAKWAIA